MLEMVNMSKSRILKLDFRSLLDLNPLKFHLIFYLLDLMSIRHLIYLKLFSFQIFSYFDFSLQTSFDVFSISSLCPFNSTFYPFDRPFNILSIELFCLSSFHMSSFCHRFSDFKYYQAWLLGTISKSVNLNILKRI